MDTFATLFTIENLFTLAMLIMLQAVLGFDNLLYISIESRRVAAAHQARVRRIGIGLAILLRIVLLVAILRAVQYLQDPLFRIDLFGFVRGDFNLHSLVVLFGGVFIIYTAIKEIYHLLSVHDIAHEHGEGQGTRSLSGAIFWIVLMNLIFSFDSILSAMALTDNIWVMSVAIIASGVMMIWLADGVSEFLRKNRMYEVLGLFILFIVGIMLVSEGGHLAHLTLFGFAVEPLAKSTFYFTLFVLVIVDIVQGQYQKRLLAARERESEQVRKSHGEAT